MNLRIKQVKSESEYNVWYSLYSIIFPEPEDKFLRSFIWNWFKKEAETKQLLLIIEYDTKPVGFIWEMTNPNLSCSYYYYFGVLEKYRNLGIFSSCHELNESYLIKKGIDLLIAEPKNPRVIMVGGKKTEAIRRINFYLNKIRFHIVSDLDIPYYRHYPPDRLGTIQENYLISFKPLSKEVEKKMLLNGKLRKNELRKIYLCLSEMELSIKSESVLRSKSVAAEKFLSCLENSKKEYFALLNQCSLT